MKSFPLSTLGDTFPTMMLRFPILGPVRYIAGAAVAIWLLAGHRPAIAETIGISIPLSGDFTEIGERFRIGVKLAMEKEGANHRLFITDDGCDPDVSRLAAEDLLSQNVGFVGGFSCNDAAITIATELSDNQIPIVVSDAQSPRLIKDRDRESWNIWRVAPGDDYPVKKAADAIANLWSQTPFAIVDDGTIYGRSFTDQLRLELDERGIKPQISDSFRAAQSTQAGLIRRLQRSGVSSAFVAAATTEDLVTIAKDNQELGININLITSEAMMVLPFLAEAAEIPAGIKVVGWPEPRDEELDNRLKAMDIEPDRVIYQGYATIQIAAQATGNSLEQTTQNLATKSFSTVLGPIEFLQDGSSTFNPFRLLEWDGEKFIDSPIEAVSQ